MRRLAIWLSLAFSVVAILSGCMSGKQTALADDLYFRALIMDGELVELEESIPDAMNSGDLATIEQAIIKGDEFKREWRKVSTDAKGELARASETFARSLDARVEFYEAASRTAKYRSVEFSREALRKQTEAYDLAAEALGKLEQLSQ